MDGNPDSTATVTVIVDSTSSLTAEHIGDLPIEVVPLQLTVGVAATTGMASTSTPEEPSTGKSRTKPSRRKRRLHPPLRSMQHFSACLCFRQGRALHHDSLEAELYVQHRDRLLRSWR